MEIGKGLGLEGRDLREYIEQGQAQERRERASECEEQRQIREAEEQKQIREAEAEEREKARSYELERLRIEVENRKAGTAFKIERGPKLPAYDEHNDSMDAYIRRFEIYATANRWGNSDWATYLASLLKGSALEVYTQMATGDINNYSKLKIALLKRFQLTEEGFRKKFHGIRMQKGETASQFITKLEDYLNKWLELAEVTNSYDELHDFILMEQFLHACPDVVAIHIREKDLRSKDDIMKSADLYIEAHKLNVYSFKSKRSTEQQNGGNNNVYQTKPQNPNMTTLKPEVKTVNTHNDNKKLIECWLCNKRGHRANECSL